MTEIIPDRKRDSPKRMFVRSQRAARCTSIVAGFVSIAGIALIGYAKSVDALLATGMVQPLLAFALSCSFVSAVRGWGGRLFEGSRRGETRPSPALVLGRLWLQCFVAIMAAILLTAFVAKLSYRFREALTRWGFPTRQSDDS